MEESGGLKWQQKCRDPGEIQKKPLVDTGKDAKGTHDTCPPSPTYALPHQTSLPLPTQIHLDGDVG